MWWKREEGAHGMRYLWDKVGVGRNGHGMGHGSGMR